jgi:hypothetical protein
MKSIFFQLFFTYPILCFSQEIKISSSVGYATASANTFKKNIFCTGVNVGYEFSSHKSVYLLASLGTSVLRYDHIDSNNMAMYNSNYFLGIAFSVRKYFIMTSKDRSFIELGLAGDHFIYDRKELNSGSFHEIKKQVNLGYNAGIFFAVGYKKMITHSLSFELALCGHNDYFSCYKNETNRIKLNKRMLSLSFYKKLR